MVLVLIIAIAIVMLIGPVSGAKPTPTATPTLTPVPTLIHDDPAYIKILNLETLVNSLKGTVDGLTTTVEGLTKSVSDLQSNTVTKAQYDALDAKITALQTYVDTLEARIDALENPVCGDEQCTGTETYETCPEDCSAPCNLPNVVCNGACVNLINSRLHCGSCENACAGTDMCVGGECVAEKPCGDTYCDPATEDQNNCPEDCGSPCTPTNGGVETCDGFDNDCDGNVDNGFDVGLPCGSDVGLCQFGVYVCSSKGFGTECIGAVGPLNEVCDDQDNNCDGQTDEGFNLGAPCSQGIGACYRAGSYVCTSNQLTTECDAIAGTPVAELCGDGLDNNCDGQTDEGCPV